MLNLDFEAAKAGQALIGQAKECKIARAEVENLLTKTLGVLQSNGPYACILYLSSRSKEGETAGIVRDMLLDLTTIVVDPRSEGSTECEYISAYVCTDLEAMLLVKRIWEQTLIYARYGAKAMEDI